MPYIAPVRSLALAVFFAAALAPAAQAADALTEAVQAAYPPYRAALFRTNGKVQAEAEQALAQARQAWSGLLSRFGAGLPAPYDRDPKAAATLSEVSAVYERAAAQVAARDLAAAHETLEHARDLLADLRRRNGVIVFSDHMNAYHEVMETVLGEGAAQLASPAGQATLLARTGALDYLSRRLRSEAPPALAGNAEFTAAQQQVQASVDALLQALARQDATAARDALDKLKKPYSQLFLKFG